ncbi:MAG: OmpA family protein [Bacteroidota bacterium]
MKKTTLFLGTGIIAVAILLLSSCSGGGSLSRADGAKSRYQYKYAADLYSQLAPKIKDKNEAQRARMEAAFCYRMANEYDKAIKAYDKALKKEPKNTEALYQAGKLKMLIAGDCNAEALREARVYFKKYLEEVPNDERVLKKIAAIDSAENWRKDSPKNRFKVSNVKTLNTKASEYCPMIASKKDDKLFFTTDREGGMAKKKIDPYIGFSYHDMWVATGKKVKKSAKNPNPPITFEKPAIVLGTVNTKFNDGTCCFDRKFQIIYYTQCNGGDGKSKTCKLMQGKFNGTEWTDEQMLSFCINDTFNYGHPTLSDDGKRLYFSSDRPDGLGGYDIWVCTYNQRAKDWSDPVNLGETINTDQNEMYPYWNSHDASLYFSSTGHLGMGGLDIFRSEGGGTEWSEPENLRAPLNSGGDDFGVTFDINKPDHGYFSSNRCDSKGSDDIYEFRVDPLCIELEGYVYECIPNSNPQQFNNSKPLANSTITITNDKDSVKMILKTDANGYYRTVCLKEKTNYEILCQNLELYYFDAEIKQKTTRGIKISTVLRQDFCLQSQIIEQVVPIYYDLDKANIRPDAAKVLDETILPLLKKYPKLRMELGSHTDCRSSYAYNEDLSQRRADSAVAYLVRNGIDARRLVAKGYGESQLVNDCKCEGAIKVPCTEDLHQQNRRTTIKTLDVNFDSKVKEVLSGDKNNTNVRAIIVKMTKKENRFEVTTTGNNGAESVAAVAPGADFVMSLAELKNLVAKGLIKPEDLTGITIADINAGKFKPNASVRLNTLRVGPKDRGYTMTNVVVKIAASGLPYILGFDALKANGGTVNTDEGDGEITFKNVNTDAMKNGAIDSKLAPGTGTTGTTGTPGTTKAPAADTVSLADYKSINLIQENGLLMLPTMINDKENVNWSYDEKGRKIEITEDMVKQLLDSKTITKNDFEDGETVKLGDGTKLRSNTFTIAKLQIGDVILENVRVTVNSKITVPTIGGLNALMKKNNAVVKGTVLYLKPKEKRTKPGTDE